MTMEYRKVGRGGAGNYYSQQDIQGASKRAAQVSRSPLPQATLSDWYICSKRTLKPEDHHLSASQTQASPPLPSMRILGVGVLAT